MRLRALLSSLFLISHIPVAFSQNAPPLPKAPAGFDITIFAQPPRVNYPVCLTAAPTGEVFVGIDKQGSLGKKPGDGRVERCIDTDGDGVADEFNTFAKMDHPRGLIYDNGKLWVLHPPYLTLFHDDDKDGKADRSETLIEGISTNQVHKRGADHTTNGIRMGIDGWIYIAVGDFGFVNAKGKDGRMLTLKGGGIVRVRPNGSEMETYCVGLRNILDVCIDPRLNMFTRDNTNDGGGWDIRLSHIVQTANYGYPSLFKNFSDEIMPPLADYGGGSGCGAMFLSEPFMPKPYQRALLTCDWGRGEVFFHPLTPNGPTYKAGQETFLKIDRPTDIDVDGSGRLYVSSWRGGQFRYKDENVGYVVQLKKKGQKPASFPDLSKLGDQQLLAQLQSASHVRRLHTQREILRRSPKADFANGLMKLIQGNDSLDTRVAALFTYKQLYGAKANAHLVQFVDDADLREYVLRALTDRRSQLVDVPLDLFTKSLNDKNPRVQLSALIGLGRLGKSEAGQAVLPLAVPPKTATTAKVVTAAFRSGVVKGKKAVKVRANIKDAKKLFLVATDGGNGIGLDHVVWLEPTLTGAGGEKKLTELKWTSAKAGWGGVHVNRDCTNRPIRFNGKILNFGIGTHAHSVIEYDLPKGYTKFQARAALDDGGRGGQVRFYVFTDVLPDSYRNTSGAVVKDGSKSVLPHVAVKTLVKLDAVEACLDALDGPYRRGAVWALRYLHDPKAVDGLIERLPRTPKVGQRHAILRTLIRLYHKEDEYKGSWWGTRPDTTGPYYHRATWKESPRIATALRNELLSAPSDTVEFMIHELNRHRVELKNLPPDLAAKAKKRDIAPNIKVSVPTFDRNNPNQLGNIALARILKQSTKQTGSVQLGAKLFKSQSCHACHTTAPGQRPIGPPLVDIAKRYNRQQIIESIIKPSAQLAQGFASNLFLMKNGTVHTGFVIREAAEEIEIRTSEGKSVLLATNAIDERIASKQSIMPEGLVNNLSVSELSSLVAYLQSLRAKD